VSPRNKRRSRNSAQNETREREIAKQQAQEFLKTLEQIHAGSRQDSLTSVTDTELSDDKIVVIDIVKPVDHVEPISEVANSEVRAILEPPQVFQAEPL